MACRPLREFKQVSTHLERHLSHPAIAHSPAQLRMNSFTTFSNGSLRLPYVSRREFAGRLVDAPVTSLSSFRTCLRTAACCYSCS